MVVVRARTGRVLGSRSAPRLHSDRGTLPGWLESARLDEKELEQHLVRLRAP